MRRRNRFERKRGPESWLTTRPRGERPPPPPSVPRSAFVLIGRRQHGWPTSCCTAACGSCSRPSRPTRRAGRHRDREHGGQPPPDLRGPRARLVLRRPGRRAGGLRRSRWRSPRAPSALLAVLAPRAGRPLEIAVLVGANALATAVRFLLLRAVIAARGRDPAHACHRSIRRDAVMTTIARPAGRNRWRGRPGAAPQPRRRDPAGEAAWIRRRHARRARPRGRPLPRQPDGQRLRQHVLLGGRAGGLAELVGLVLRLVRRGQLHHRRQAAARRR